MDIEKTTEVVEKKVDILGSEWTVRFVNDDPAFDSAHGWEDFCSKTITIENVKVDKNDVLAVDLKSAYINQKRVIRHEILHAFLDESGLSDDSCSTDNWAINEEMVDWFAIQSPKIFKVYKELNAL